MPADSRKYATTMAQSIAVRFMVAWDWGECRRVGDANIGNDGVGQLHAHRGDLACCCASDSRDW